MGFRDQLGYVLGQHDVPVTETWGCEELVLDTDLYYIQRRVEEENSSHCSSDAHRGMAGASQGFEEFWATENL